MLPDNWVAKLKRNPTGSVSYLKNRLLSTGELQYNVRRGGPLRGAMQYLGEQYARVRFSGHGTPVYDADWDVLVVLDACRSDLFRSVLDEYEYLPGMETVRSLGSWTGEWMKANFTDDYAAEMATTAYLSGNPQSRYYLAPAEFACLDEVWTYAWDDDLGTVPPRPLTDRAIRVARERSPERMIVHYLQPHVPFIGSEESPPQALAAFAGGKPEQVAVDDWIQLLRGDRERAAVLARYRQNLRRVLDDIRLLVGNVDASPLVITSDHGNAVGEYGVYGHPGVPLPCLREVPWCELETVDSGTHEPATYSREAADVSVDGRLHALGYSP